MDVIVYVETNFLMSVDHANHYPALKKAVLTDNTKDFSTPEVLAALAAIGIGRPFRTVENVLGWLGSL